MLQRPRDLGSYETAGVSACERALYSRYCSDVVRAEITIEHGHGDLLAEIKGLLGPHDAVALAESSFASKSPRAAATLTYAARMPTAVVLAWATPGRLVLYVESSGRLRRAAREVWDVLRRSESPLNPQLTALVLLDEDSNDDILEAHVGLIANLGRPELALSLATGVITLVWLVIALAVFRATGDLVLGAIPGLVSSLSAGVALIVGTWRRTLVWR
jgi:hypothetical protein